MFLTLFSTIFVQRTVSKLYLSPIVFVSKRNHNVSRACVAFVQLRWSTLCRHQRLLEVGRLPAWRSFRRQPVPKFVERRLRGRRMAVRAVQLGRAASSQRQRSAQSGRQREIRQSQVRSPSFCSHVHVLFSVATAVIIRFQRLFYTVMAYYNPRCLVSVVRLHYTTVIRSIIHF